MAKKKVEIILPDCEKCQAIMDAIVKDNEGYTPSHVIFKSKRDFIAGLDDPECIEIHNCLPITRLYG